MELTREEQFTELLAEVGEPLQRFLCRRSTEPEDLLSDVLLVLWRRLDDVPAEGRLPWTYGVAHGCLRNAERASARRFRLIRRLAQEPVAPAPDEDPALAEALEAMTPEDRDVLRLWAWEQLPAREIATVLGITPNAASVRVHRATTRLRTALVGKDGGAAGHSGVEGTGRGGAQR